ncbi:methyltransferase domain-containing protein [Sphingomonas sp.]|uniref:class I SAM-dependent methyltransferase n=1 Tax=Sphingomonas sp. TaxID=28214 RepID=UPI0017AE8E36|nr:methyltransferase domain-containing protein [Sphingomonas sp.]MBA4763686.1 class I SAM-dependent methyltransferase [Sphingomonas sp.]
MTRWIAAAFAISLCPIAASAQADLSAAVAGPGRPVDQIALDASRKPAEVLAFLGLKPGDVAADIMAGSGYYTEIMARAVGPKGRVIAVEPTQFYIGQPKAIAAWDALKGRAPNVELTVGPFGTIAAAPASLDFTLMHLVYHDLYWESAQYKVPRVDPAAFLKSLYAATKPGGIVGVVDHVGAAGDTRAIVDALHRIDPAVIKADFKAAGFILEGESPLLRVVGDDIAKLVFDPAVRGKTDRVVYRFRKPG